MARITCRVPATGKPFRLTIDNIPATPTWTTLAEANDFSVPDASNIWTNRDPLDSSRAIRAGELYLATPLWVHIFVNSTEWISVRLLQEDGTVIPLVTELWVINQETVQIPVQGRSLLKRNPASSNGDRLQIQARTVNRYACWLQAEERLSAEHVGVV
jgi:hypothetical protein